MIAVPLTCAMEEEFKDVRAMSGENGNLAKSETRKIPRVTNYND